MHSDYSDVTRSRFKVTGSDLLPEVRTKSGDFPFQVNPLLTLLLFRKWEFPVFPKKEKKCFVCRCNKNKKLVLAGVIRRDHLQSSVLLSSAFNSATAGSWDDGNMFDCGRLPLFFSSSTINLNVTWNKLRCLQYTHAQSFYGAAYQCLGG